MAVTAVMTRPSVVTCLGSSTTAARGQAFDWIGALQKRPRNARFRFVNLGVGGDLAYNALRRLHKVIASRPAEIVIMIGGNEVLARVFRNVGRSSP